MIFHSYLNDCLKHAKLLQEQAANPVDSDNCEAAVKLLCGKLSFLLSQIFAL